jgi:hypothetical protein
MRRHVVRIARALGPKSHVFAQFGRVRPFPLSATRPAFSDLHVSLAPRSFLLIRYSPLITTTHPRRSLFLNLWPRFPVLIGHIDPKQGLVGTVFHHRFVHQYFHLFHPVSLAPPSFLSHQSHPMPLANRGLTQRRSPRLPTGLCHLRHYCSTSHQSNPMPLASRRSFQR